MRIPTQKFHNVLTLLLAFSLPLDMRIAPILIALLALNWLLEWDWREKFSNCKAHKLSLLPILLYLLYCIGMIYSDNIGFGMKDLETKLSLLLLPLIFASKPSLTKAEIDRMFHYFIAGCSVAIVICFSHSLYIYCNEMYRIKTGIINNPYASPKYFFSSELSYFMHPSYFAMYLCLSITYLFSRVVDFKSSLSFKSRSIFTSLIIAFTIFVVFLASRMGIIVLAFILLWAILFIVMKKKYYLTGIASLLLLATAFFLMYKNSEIIASRIDYTLHTLVTKNLDKTSSESSTVRVLIWEQAATLIKEYPFLGVGTGDIKDVLFEKYRSEGMTGAYEHKLNAHNQFLQTGIALGIPGLLLIISILICPLFVRNYRSLLFVFFSINILLNFSVESMLETQAGVIFFSFFFSMLCMKNIQNNE